MPGPLTGYGREGATVAHWVRSVQPGLAVCGAALQSIPLHQIPPARVCAECQRLSAVIPPLPASVLGDEPDSTGVCPGCGDVWALDVGGRIQPHQVERVRSGRVGCGGAGQPPEVTP